MRRQRLIVAAALLVATVLSAATAGAAAAEASSSLRVLRPVDLSALPLLVMEHEHLIERTAEAMGLGEIAVIWQAPGQAPGKAAPGKAGPLAALLAGRADLAMVDLAPFLSAADAGSGGGAAAELRAVAAIVQRPYVLLARNKAIHTIRDFSAGDRIAVPALKVSGPALMLEMAAAQEWGPEHYDKLDRLLVARSDAAAAAALLSGKGEIDAHFSRSPYVDAELNNPAIHRVMDSFDIAGPHSDAVLAATLPFRAANPELCKAVLAALQAADDYIAKSPGAAAEIYADMAKDQDIPLEELSDMLGDPDLAYQAAPTGVLRIAAFMHRIGRLKRSLRAWQELFLPEARDLPGS
jgi:NitT/TauT family transport system substrate-binding protein